MAKPSKSTKKFQSKHLKHTIEHRREVQKHNKKVQQRKRGAGKKSGDDEETETPATTQPKEVFNDMSVDDFFAGGFEVPKEKKFQKKNDVEEDEDEESSDEEDEEAMKADMKNLAEKDPEFYQYLQNNDKDLLDFEGVNPLDAMSEDEEDEEEEEEEEEAKTKKPKKAAVVEQAESNKVEITTKLVNQWENQLNTKPNVKTIKNISIAFKAAVNIQNAEDEDYKYAVTDPEAFNLLMLLCLQKIPVAIQKLVKYKVHASTGARTVPEKNQNVKPISAILKSMAGSYITLLQDINNTETAALVLVSLQEVFPYYLSYRRLLKELLNSVVEVWSTTAQVETQIATFAFLNNASREYPKTILETVLKSTYSHFLKNCRQTNVHTMSRLNFCKNSAAELFGIDETLGYQIGFEFVRQSAIHLRNSINATTNASNEKKDGYKIIYNWQYCHSLDFWSRVLAQRCQHDQEPGNKKESPLRQLIYPLVQVTLGAIRLIPTAQFFPLRFYLIRSLIRLQQGSGVYIPIFPLLAEILTSTAITKSPKRGGPKLEAVDFEHNIKVNQAYLGSKQSQDGICEQFIELASEFFVMYTKSIAFPELVTPAVLLLRRFTKKSKNIKFNKQLQQLVEKLNTNSDFIASKRSNVEYGPSNKQEVQLFLNDFDWEKTPLGQYVVVQRKVKEERVKMLKESLADEEEAKRIQKEKDEEESDIEMEEEEEEESEDEE